MYEVESAPVPRIYPVEIDGTLVNLRAFIASDSERLFDSYFQSIDAAHFLSRLPHRSLAQTQAVLQNWCLWNKMRDEPSFGWVIADRTNNFPVGVFYVIQTGCTAEIHYGVGVPFWNRGFATEAVELATQWLLSSESVHRVWTAVDLENTKTRRVLEKAGFKPEQILTKWAVLPALSEGAARDAISYCRCKPGSSNAPNLSQAIP